MLLGTIIAVIGRNPVWVRAEGVGRVKRLVSSIKLQALAVPGKIELFVRLMQCDVQRTQAQVVEIHVDRNFSFDLFLNRHLQPRAKQFDTCLGGTGSMQRGIDKPGNPLLGKHQHVCQRFAAIGRELVPERMAVWKRGKSGRYVRHGHSSSDTHQQQSQWVFSRQFYQAAGGRLSG